jgi:hypothetical protein
MAQFQGIPLFIETPRGSVRHWHDPHNGESGETHMVHDYGYVKHTLGTDDEEVDVYVGPNKESTKVFVVTQMKAPTFVEVDEQKCMLGFNSAEEAKTAYLRHYNNERFFGSIQEMTLEEFKSKIKSQRGVLLKGSTTSAILRELAMSNKKEVTDILKGITSRMASYIRRRAEAEARTQEVPEVDHNPGAMELLDRSNVPFEPTRVYKSMIHNQTEVHTSGAYIPYEPCGSCGHMTKSATECPHCEFVRATNADAKPIWRR